MRPAEPFTADGAVMAATTAALAAASRTDTPAGQAALVLAGRIDNGHYETGPGMAALTREHRAALADALSGAEQDADPIDELRQRRQQRLTGE